MDELAQRPPQARPRRAASGTRITERDCRLLAFAAEHRLVLAPHVQALLGVSAGAASARLRALTQAGYLRYERKLSGPGGYLIDRKGLGAIGSSLSRPREVDLACFKHDVGLAWLWLAASRGAFGELQDVVSERRMRSHDGCAEGRSEPLGVRLPGVGPRGGDRRHYSDLLLETRTGHRVAVELELTPKSRVRREEILGGYASDARIDAVLYLVEKDSIGRAIASSAAAVGISSLVHVQRAQFAPDAGVASAGRRAHRAGGRVVEGSEHGPGRAGEVRAGTARPAVERSELAR